MVLLPGTTHSMLSSMSADAASTSPAPNAAYAFLHRSMFSSACDMSVTPSGPRAGPPVIVRPPDEPCL